METTFTPYASLIGGILIGISAALLMAVSGRIMGATGILAGAFDVGNRKVWAERIALLAGMAAGPIVMLFATGAMPAVQIPVSNMMLAIGGLIVGIGVTFGGGCTSGHGVCGMARLSPRSIVATVSFMIATGITVFVVRHVLGV